MSLFFQLIYRKIDKKFVLYSLKGYLVPNSCTMPSLSKEVNPFISALAIPYVEMIKSVGNNKISDDTYEIFEVERSAYNRLYVSKQAREFFFTNLTMYARDMFFMIQYMVNPDYTYVIITYEKIADNYKSEKYGKRRYEETMRELTRWSIIDLRDRNDNSYWYNPIFFAAGDRLKMYPDNKVKVATKKIYFKPVEHIIEKF